MVLFIFESIGTSELILIGIVALIILGPRKLPEMARKMGKIMSDFRNTTSEFKETWEREINFEEEAKALRTGELTDTPIPRVSQPDNTSSEGLSIPEIKEIDSSSFDRAEAEAIENGNSASEKSEPADIDPERDTAEPDPYLSDRKNWL